MTRFLFILPLLLCASVASAQQPGHDACARDVSRFCRAVMNNGDGAVLACLKQNRTRLSKACDKVLTEHGQ
ncbi:cysteine rich repeat-containing protein [Bradyrhizobium guangxiense]|uniref:cysteine rich repeat-containing protein n=1 Tax=Bradyrhizobium guangxiense TaxID=1325115 RepID=UPI0010087852|nr:cysteine rich repeat-containing protein [Bradyrhizobium guangxiense]